MTIQIKICGLSTPETVDAAVDAGATHIGLVHFSPSPRHVSLDQAAALRRRVPGRVKVVLLTVNMEPAPFTAAIDAVRPDIIQFHGNETTQWLALVKQHAPYQLWKAVGVKNHETFERARKWDGVVDRLLYDAPAAALPGGNGLAVDWSLFSKGGLPNIPWGLAGGLNPANVADAIRQTGAELVDASSGLESAPGIKEVDRIKAFCEAARGA
ncbi:phosphoribosylanthranilate isomerase [Altererythrobacter aquiaggeris]|uniref:phosphoribosylanthranilate isomerase n=1 Tax=Aestuarierythrobacter aquiaggeris TaxID=1898396 RepID=UPI0030167F29